MAYSYRECASSQVGHRMPRLPEFAEQQFHRDIPSSASEIDLALGRPKIAAAYFGENDDNPSQQDMLTLDKELTSLGKDYRFYTYPEAGHAFMDFSDKVRHNQRASAMSWPRTLDFLEKHVKN